MKKLGLLCVLPLTFAGLSFADQISGYVSEAHCGAKHNAVSDANTKCIDACLKHGSDPVLVKGDAVLTFDADSKEKAKAFAGQQVSIDGSVDGNVVKINSIQKAGD